MNKKWLPYFIILALAVALFFVRRWNQEREQVKVEAKAKDKGGSGKAKPVNRDRGFDRRVEYLEYTKHANCRMDCRKISEAEVKEIMNGGVINYNKSNVKANPCPTYALEGITSDKQRVRIVYAQCDTKTKVVTVIDLDEEWACACPGDEEKYKNKR